MRRHHLHAVAGQDVLLDTADRVLVVVAGIAGAEFRLGGLRATQVQASARGDRLAQRFQQALQACLALFKGLIFSRVDQHNRVHLACQVVEHHHRIGHHQQDIRHAQRVRVGAGAKALFHVTHTIIAKVADQAAVEARQTRDVSDFVTVLETFDKGQRVFDIMAFHLDAILQDTDVIAVHPHHRARWQADHRVAAPLLAALHRFEQVRVGWSASFR